MNEQQQQTQPPRSILRNPLVIAIAATALMALGAIYGIATYALFRKLAGVSGSSMMLVSFLFGVPMAIGLLVGYIARARKVAGLPGAAALSTMALGLCIFAAGALLREGTICIVMALPLLLIGSLVGTLVGGLMASMRKRNGPQLLSVTLVLPMVVAPIEARVPVQAAMQVIERDIFIDAPAEQIWHHINYPLNIQPDELAGGFAYRIGMPYPIEARTLQERVGGSRALKWQRGIQFNETITAWREPEHIAWDFDFAPDSFPPGSLDDHIVIGGRYFDLLNAAYTLLPENSGTRLHVRVEARVTTGFNWYAGWWARLLIRDTAGAILKFYKNRAESRRAPTGQPRATQTRATQTRANRDTRVAD